MTRKRYIKLMMAYGVSRNKAQAMAKKANSEGLSYAFAYERDKEVLIGTYSRVINLIVDAISGLMNGMLTALHECFQRAADSFKPSEE